MGDIHNFPRSQLRTQYGDYYKQVATVHKCKESQKHQSNVEETHIPNRRPYF